MEKCSALPANRKGRMSGTHQELYDAIVVGAGIEGCFTTYHFTKNKRKVLLLEQFFLPHSRGSSHGQSRIIRRAYPEDFYTKMMEECYQIWAQLENESGTKLYRQTGLLVLGKKEEAEIRTIQDNLSKQGAEHKYFDAEELRRCFPNIRFPREQVGIWEPHAGVLFADKALKALQDLIRQLGGVIHDGEKVVEIKPGYPVTVTTATRTYQAKSLVITAGPWTNQLLLPLGMQLPLQALRINVCYWREKVPGSYGKNFPCFIGSFPDLAPHHIYGLPAREYPGLVKVCYHHGNKADPDERDCPSASSEVADVQILSSFVRDYLPSLQPRPAIMERCMYTNTPDQNFILDRHPKHANIVIGAGFSGHGFKLSPVVGKVLYELSTGSTLSYDPTPFQIRRFQGLNNASL
ncbi:peroxisomal sarcosine oxidase isoform X2 [Dromiciops gliroides]|uniref:peroxisomal sarcosine oxidase isoform X2 n=1 Tax=Dromiciops gliroides TaxID=33562 RepID=UPI001CC7D3F2|nr:peroxisomal sarcosine oxidase isoform X2 [Dromiciops gliroides]